MDALSGKYCCISTGAAIVCSGRGGGGRRFSGDVIAARWQDDLQLFVEYHFVFEDGVIWYVRVELFIGLPSTGDTSDYYEYTIPIKFVE